MSVLSAISAAQRESTNLILWKSSVVNAAERILNFAID